MSQTKGNDGGWVEFKNNKKRLAPDRIGDTLSGEPCATLSMSANRGNNA